MRVLQLSRQRNVRNYIMGHVAETRKIYRDQERNSVKLWLERKWEEKKIVVRRCPHGVWYGRERERERKRSSGKPWNLEITPECTRLCRLTETARLLKNVKSVFTRRSNAASRVNVEVELSRKLASSTESYTSEKLFISTLRCSDNSSLPTRSLESIGSSSRDSRDSRTFFLFTSVVNSSTPRLQRTYSYYFAL